ncbi:MAG: tRNA pseudouridine(55) synthase TruB [Clostridiales bacterium]|nr:tRNA pseudouridine(55) synthase TruB [Clostridiales bacterium]
MNGFVVINKNSGISSSDIVIKVRNSLSKALNQKQKAGHLGTLDPEAEGVLTVALGSATKLFDYFLKKTKTYIADFVFGSTTDTLDRAGKITSEGGRIPDTDEIKNALLALTGEIRQVPPAYSAVSVNGKRAYELARQGKEIDLKEKTVNVYEFTHLMALDKEKHRFKIVCGSGTYIRSLARDLASKLGTVAYMSGLLRTQDGNFTIENSVTLKEFLSEPLKYVIPVEDAFSNLTKVKLDDSYIYKLLNGVNLDINQIKSALVDYTFNNDIFALLNGSDSIIGLGEINKEKLKLKYRLL